MSAHKQDNRKLADYLHARLQHLEDCSAAIETKISYDLIDVGRKIDEGIYDRNDPEIRRIMHHLEIAFGNTMRSALLVSVCSFLEAAITEITRRLVADYDARFRSQKKGNWLKKHVRVLCQSAGLDSAPIQEGLDDFSDLITLRNWIVHNWGGLPGARVPSTVLAATERIETVAILKNGCPLLGDQVVPCAINAAEDIAEHILTSKMNVSIT